MSETVIVLIIKDSYYETGFEFELSIGTICEPVIVVLVVHNYYE